jgi:hypothetical protein
MKGLGALVKKSTSFHALAFGALVKKSTSFHALAFVMISLFGQIKRMKEPSAIFDGLTITSRTTARLIFF